MENSQSNYDMFDQVIQNNRKQKSWTAFWVIMLCIMAGGMLYLVNAVAKQNNEIRDQKQIIQTSTFDLEMKSRIIDSLTENCNQAKEVLIKNFDSAIVQTQNSLQTISGIEKGRELSRLSTEQKAELKKANESIQRVKNNLKVVTAEIEKENTRLFVHYNDPRYEKQVNLFLEYANGKMNFVIAPPEYDNQVFRPAITFYNYQNEPDEKRLKELLSKLFRINPDDILVSRKDNAKIKPTIEVWIGTRKLDNIKQQMQQPMPVQKNLKQN